MNERGPPPGLQPGDHFDRYRIEGFLGRGGMGDVYRAFDTRLRRAVALKVLRRERASGPEELQRVLAEAQAMAGIAHRNIVTVYDVAAHEGTAYFTMELLDGGPLQRWVGPSNGHLADKLRWLREIASALVAVHASGLLHRDVKPGNILVSSDGTIKLLDFGIAKRLGAVDTQTPPQTARFTPETATGLVVGTPRYMAPEQLLGQRASPETDQYAWALVATELFTGMCPRPADDVTAPLAHAGVPRTVAAIIVRAKHMDPRERFPAMAELGRALELVSADPSAGRGTPTAQEAPLRFSGAPATGLNHHGAAPVPSASGPTWSDYPTTGGPTAPPYVMPIAPMMPPPIARRSGAAGVVALVIVATGALAIVGVVVALLAIGGTALFTLAGTGDPPTDASAPPTATATVVSPPLAASPLPPVAPSDNGAGRPKQPSAPKADAGGAPLVADAGAKPAPKPSPTPAPTPIPPRNVRVAIKSSGKEIRRSEIDAQIALLKPQIDACYRLPNCSIETTYMCIDPVNENHYTPQLKVGEDGVVFTVLNGGAGIALNQCLMPILKKMRFTPFDPHSPTGRGLTLIDLDIVLL